MSGTEIVAALFPIIALVLLSGLFSGLTLGLLGLDLYGLEIAMASDSKEAAHAAAILPIRKRGNLLLCTLLLGNVAVNSALSVLMAATFSEFTAFLLSTTLIVLFGEIVPQSVCSRYALLVGSKTTWLVWALIVVMLPITWPISKVLDLALGEELGTIYDKKGLKKLVQIHREGAAALHPEEADIMSGALVFAEKKVREVMTPVEKCFMLDMKQKLDFDTLANIFQSGFSRIPIVDFSSEQKKVCGLLFVKDLILLDPDDEVAVQTLLNFYGHEVTYVFSDCSLKEVFCDFKSGRSHLAIVVDVCTDGPGDPYYSTCGLVTLEDIVEVILQDNIVDETDVFVNMAQQNPVPHRARVDRSQLSLFNPRLQSADVLTGPELNAVFHHLRGTVPSLVRIPENRFRQYLSLCSIAHVLVQEVPANSALSAEGTRLAHEMQRRRSVDISDGGISVYKSNEEASSAFLLLDGRIRVHYGRGAGFETFLGRWQALGLECMEQSDGGNEDDSRRHVFVPDFSAEVVRTSRLLVMDLKAFWDMSSGKDRQENGSELVDESREPQEVSAPARSIHDSLAFSMEIDATSAKVD